MIISEMGTLPINIKITSWDDFFGLLKALLMQKKYDAIIFDEFQYIPQQDPAFISIFQRWWDLEFSKKNINIILCGSYTGMMEKIVLEHTVHYTEEEQDNIRLCLWISLILQNSY
ncbi:AAA family ATPase [Marinitoga litoralis]|uniref:AAA family ATPase n=1 Tax=Marinitoga litoralis TaxID=570855 RepID=UPI0019619BB8|nr:hypothetical protein [Marinitoga litoralis]MBM7560380.1 AAA+ ATPase superfamily predicted ATPase [Marinitoga litoralis]